MENNIITEAVSKVKIGSSRSIEEAASALIESVGDPMKVGESCIVIDDPTYPFSGQKGVVQSVSENNAYYNVKFDNGTVAAVMSNQLLKA